MCFFFSSCLLSLLPILLQGHGDVLKAWALACVADVPLPFLLALGRFGSVLFQVLLCAGAFCPEWSHEVATLPDSCTEAGLRAVAF